MEISKEPAQKVLADLEREVKPDAETFAYAERVVTAVSAQITTLDKIIAGQCKNWDLDRVALLDKNILRMAVAEILYFEDIPEKVSIDEAIELAKGYSTDKSGTFVNGILDPIAFKEKPKA
ncbi:MAG: transcription antitermination factor NusB [Elusimicrobia bacterium RIFOXYB2_FULL_49_7]|nr:MAG: transcription antitermination factor NusB [Elusimicrobia bacterium RIFOXYB2_FULL_49_7]